MMTEQFIEGYFLKNIPDFFLEKSNETAIEFFQKKINDNALYM